MRNCQLSGVITGNLLLRYTANLVYSLNGGVRIGRDIGGAGDKPNGAQGILTIEPGVVIFGASGADFLLIERGSQIFAEGTATRPIVFTSRTNMEGTAGDNAIGQWGGLVILGRAPIHTCIGSGITGGSVNCESQVEGAGGFYGGATPTDNSGRLRYVQVRYPGFEVSTNNELNGITFAGVGSGTFAENIQVHNSSDDGIEWFGGRVNHRYVVITGADDDSLDTDFGYRGNIQFGLVYQRSGGGDRMIEAETTGFDLRSPRSRPTFANISFIGRRAPNGLLFRGGTDFNVWNSVIQKDQGACVQFADAFTITTDSANDKVGPPNLRSVFMACAGGAANGSGGVTTQQVTDILSETGRNNVLTGTSTLTGTWFPGANELAVTPFNANGANSFFTNTSYIGAFSGSSDTWYNGWTCGLGGSTPACTVAPTPIQ
ncbi:hypothetical protein FJQ54_14040 [Sandaracinobacter neustonicus]|uniref:Lipoprotein n=2 Tax=Sandaracinobacter neustonicus TaxID=1715348 RepID=A0A501XFT3_9SPHN|nr:hypothetical protein FJQ54_14040 [Sandaracinobacter neustonicus]